MNEIKEEDIPILIKEIKAIPLIQKDIEYIKIELLALRKTINQQFVTNTEYQIFKTEMLIIRNIVFSFVGLILLAVGGALINLFIK